MEEESILAYVTIETGGSMHLMEIIRRGDRYFVKDDDNETETEFNGKGDDSVAISLGMTQIGLLIGAK